MRVLATLAGVEPGMLQNQMSLEQLEELRTKKRTPIERDISREDQAAKALYHGPNDELGVPATNLYAAMIEAGREVGTGTGRQKISTATSTKLPAYAFLEEEFLAFKGNPDWVVDARRGRNPNGGEAVCLIRPKFPQWELDVTLNIVDEGGVNANTITKVLEIAGQAVGLCDYRPACRGPFGRFAVKAWVPLDGPKVEGNGAGAVEPEELEPAKV